MALDLAGTWALTTNAAFMARVRAAAALLAYNIINEAPATPFHEQRLVLAQSEIRSPSEGPFLAWLLTHPLVQADGAVITDANLSAVVSALWNVACGATTSF